MAKVQPEFEQFHDAIRLRRFGAEATLREKRDIVRRKLEEQLPNVFESHGEETPRFHFRDQGSYELGTGTKPVSGDFDIDQGLYFEVATAQYPDPVVLKRRVFEAVKGQTHDVQIRRSCVTVFYQQEKEPVYHVDVAIYSEGPANTDGKDRIAKGKENSSAEHRIWELANAEALKETLLAQFTGNDRGQFRRETRYLKRWKDLNFSTAGHAAPTGIGLTVALYYCLTPRYSDPIAGKADDLEALREAVRTILDRFIPVWDSDSGTYTSRLVVLLPVEPWNDLFEQMTNSQADAFKKKLERLLEALDKASNEVDPIVSCEELRKVLGSDFPIPEPPATAKQQPRAIISSSASA